MSVLSGIDWAIVIGYLGITLGVGFWLRRLAGRDLESYFLAGRKLPGWLLGTSMVATTFAADTPLAVTGIVAKNGIAGNWFWWSLALSHLLAAFVFAKLWRRAEIVTDAELIEKRYTGRAATTLRLMRAFFFAIPINCIIMGWVIRAMGKIVSVLFPWDKWLDAGFYAQLQSLWPDWMAISSPSEGISILIGVTIATTYATMGGLPSVVITDVAQFVLAMTGSIMLAVYAVTEVGGLSALVDKIHTTYGAEAEGLLSYFPATDSNWLPIEIFLVYILVQWWAQKFSDGGGILVQRMSAAKDEGHAVRGTSWFVIAHYALRPWPWILVGLVALVIFPLESSNVLSNHAAAEAVLADREMAYPILMAEYLPAGLLGIMVAGMVAAFMSTVDTHITWGASYMARDVYQRMINPNASDKELVFASRVSVLLMVVLALAVTTQIHTIEAAWKFITVMGSGIGLVAIARWLWWRINAASEIAGLVSAAGLSVIFYTTPLRELPYHIILLWVVGISTVCMLVTTWATAPTPLPHLKTFYQSVRPMGWWGPVASASDLKVRWAELRKIAAAWLVAVVSLFGLLFGIGEWLLGSTVVGIAMTVLGALGWWVALKLVAAFEPVTQPEETATSSCPANSVAQ